MKKILSGAIIVSFLIVLTLLPVQSAAEETPFTDIQETSALYLPISFLKEGGLVSGFADGAFYPDHKVTRAEALAMVLKAARIETQQPSDERTIQLTHNAPFALILPRNTKLKVQNLTTGEEYEVADIQTVRIDAIDGTATISLSRQQEEKPFKDVHRSAWYFKTISEGKKRGIVSGDGGTEYFNPDALVNLAAALRMLFKSADITPKSAHAPIPEGIPPDAWYAHDIAYALAKTIVLSRQGAFMSPEQQLTRGEIAEMLYRFIKTQTGAEFGFASWYGDGLSVIVPPTGLEYKEKNLTAAHRTLPFGTIVRVTNTLNGKSVDVVINDRGPFVAGRVIDLSKTGFSALESPSVGVVPVMIEKIE